MTKLFRTGRTTCRRGRKNMIQVPTVLAVFIMRYIVFDSMIIFLVSVCIFAVVYCVSVFLFSCNDEEKNLLVGMIRRKRK